MQSHCTADRPTGSLCPLSYLNYSRLTLKLTVLTEEHRNYGEKANYRLFKGNMCMNFGLSWAASLQPSASHPAIWRRYVGSHQMGSVLWGHLSHMKTTPASTGEHWRHWCHRQHWPSIKYMEFKLSYKPDLNRYRDMDRDFRRGFRPKWSCDPSYR